ncbi:MAG: hypothetical protein NG747_03255 [Candidatus Brocadia sp.]|nr:hypothetical protein [Candidatus Brocadia sp.]NUO09535.1 hypothetical protein [Candidatus Brocadia sp.]
MNSLYTCQTCGMVTTSKGHLCNPIPAKKAVSCKFCGMVTGDPRHACAPQVVNLKYICDSCGRLAAKRDMLCRPSPIPKPKKVIKKAVSKKAGKSKKTKNR